jgi:hypothetical protein
MPRLWTSTAQQILNGTEGGAEASLESILAVHHDAIHPLFRCDAQSVVGKCDSPTPTVIQLKQQEYSIYARNYQAVVYIKRLLEVFFVRLYQQHFQ